MDFQSVYHLRLVSAITERTIDEVWDLVVWLPAGSAFRSMLEADGDERRAAQIFGWTIQNDLALVTANAIREQSWILAQSHSKKKVPVPDPIKGPKLAKQKPRPEDDATAMARRLMHQQ